MQSISFMTVIVTCNGQVQGFMSKRVRVDAILRNEQDTIRIQLVRLRDKGLLSTLDEAVDENLNTLLHLAVHVRSTSAIQELLHHGVKAGLRNLRVTLQPSGFSNLGAAKLLHFADRVGMNALLM